MEHAIIRKNGLYFLLVNLRIPDRPRPTSRAARRANRTSYTVSDLMFPGTNGDKETIDKLCTLFVGYGSKPTAGGILDHGDNRTVHRIRQMNRNCTDNDMYRAAPLSKFLLTRFHSHIV